MPENRETIEVPASFEDAVNRLRRILKNRRRLENLALDMFLSGWGALFYIAPGLHPDEWDNPEGGWPEGWRCLAAEAFRRHEACTIADGELYPSACSHQALADARAA